MHFFAEDSAPVFTLTSFRPSFLPRPTLQDAEQLDTHLLNFRKPAHPQICQIGWLGRR
jgi:hypothetical protein